MSAYKAGILGYLVLAAANGRAAEPVVSVYLKDAHLVPNIVFGRARTTVTGIFAEIGVPIQFQQRLETPPGVVSIVLQFHGPVPDDCHPGALAYAMPYGKSGTRIHVMFDRVSAYGPSQLTGTLLGHVMAHELAHVLQGISYHSDVGVMKAHWTGGDIEQMAFHPLSFGVLDAQSIRAGLAKDAGLTAVQTAPR